MTTFVNPHHMNSHPGVNRVQSLYDGFKTPSSNPEAGHGWKILLLSAGFVALLAFANEVVQTWSEGHLMLLWIAFWTFVFGVMACLVSPARALFRTLGVVLQNWQERQAQKRQDQLMWELAKQDPRLMSELKCAILKSQA